MGQFSWIKQDNNQPIRNNVSEGNSKGKAYMHDNKGNVWYEPNYEGYGVFGGKDYYQLLAEMNNVEGLTGDVDKDRNLGIDLAFDEEAEGVLYPNLTQRKIWEWRNEKPEHDPNQGWGGSSWW